MSSSVSVGGGAASGNSRTYLVTTQAPPSTIIPVAKVLPQPIVSTVTVMGPSVSKSKCIDFLLNYFKTYIHVSFPLATVSVTSSNVSSTSSSNEIQGTGTTSAGSSTGVYLHATSRSSTGMLLNEFEKLQFNTYYNPLKSFSDS